MTKIISGKIRITEPNGKISPYERFIITINPDGTRTLRTVTRSPKGDLLRDVNQIVSPEWRDIEAMARLFFKGDNMGSIFRRINGNTMHSKVLMREGLADLKEFDDPDHMIFGFHPIVHDSWKMSRLDTSHKDHQELLVHTVSTTWNGRTLGHGERLISKACYEKKEILDLPVGQVECEKFLWLSPFDKVLAVWRTGEANILARMSVLEGDKAGTNYELFHYEEEIF